MEKKEETEFPKPANDGAPDIRIAVVIPVVDVEPIRIKVANADAKAGRGPTIIALSPH